MHINRLLRQAVSLASRDSSPRSRDTQRCALQNAHNMVPNSGSFIKARAGAQGYMCAQNTPCLDANNQCTQRCVPLAAAWCKGICPNALQYVPSSNQAAAAAPDLSSLSGAQLAQALGAQPGSSQGRSGASKWLRAQNPSQAAPVQPEVSNVINLG